MIDTAEPLIKILIVDTLLVIAEGIVSLLSSNRLFVFDAAFNSQDCISKVRAWKPDILLLDIDLPDGSGIDLIDQIRLANPSTMVLIITDLNPQGYLTTAMARGARGFLHKSLSANELMEAIMQVYNHQLYFTCEVSLSLKSIIASGENGKKNNTNEKTVNLLTRREKEILQLLSKGLSNKEIATRLEIKIRTVEYHVSNILSKFDVTSRTEAVAIYLK